MLYLCIAALVVEMIWAGLIYFGPLKNNKSLFSNKILILYQKLLQIGLGVMFLVAAHPKFMSPYDFAELVAQYQLLPTAIVYPFSAWLPALEIVVGLGLILTPWVREMSFLIFIMLIVFIIALGQAVGRNLGITCGCFDIIGAQDKIGAWVSLLRDLALLWPTFWLVRKSRPSWIWSFSK